MARILLVFEPPDGGVAENVAQLASQLSAHGFGVEAVGPPRARIDPVLAAAGVAVHRLPLRRGYGAPADDAAALRGLIRLLRGKRYDLVHCHSAKAGVLGRLAAAACRVPAVYSPHSFPFIGDFSEARRCFATATERLLAPLTRRIICVCEAERRVAREAGLADDGRLQVVLNGSAPCDGSAEIDPRLSALREGGVLAASVAVLRPQKRVDVLIDAAPLVLERMPEARIAVVGEGPLRTELESLARRRGLMDDARFAFVDYEGPPSRHLRALDLYVLSSSWEGLPIGVLEALACGVPQVATDVGGTGEAVSAQTGVLVPRADPAALAEAMLALLGDATRRHAMARASRELHTERFGVQRMVAETAAVYRQALAGDA